MGNSTPNKFATAPAGPVYTFTRLDRNTGRTETRTIPYYDRHRFLLKEELIQLEAVHQLLQYKPNTLCVTVHDDARYCRMIARLR